MSSCVHSCSSMSDGLHRRSRTRNPSPSGSITKLKTTSSTNRAMANEETRAKREEFTGEHAQFFTSSAERWDQDLEQLRVFF